MVSSRSTFVFAVCIGLLFLSCGHTKSKAKYNTRIETGHWGDRLVWDDTLSVPYNEHRVYSCTDEDGSHAVFMVIGNIVLKFSSFSNNPELVINRHDGFEVISHEKNGHLITRGKLVDGNYIEYFLLSYNPSMPDFPLPGYKACNLISGIVSKSNYDLVDEILSSYRPSEN